MSIRYLLVALVILGGVVFFVFIGKRESLSVQDAVPSSSIILTENGFEPSKVIVVKGGTITFSNITEKPYWPASNLHPTHGIYSEFDPLRPLAPDEEWSFTFDRLGTYNFHGHLRSYFVGTIYVVEQ